jgi:hypothetical protein
MKKIIDNNGDLLAIFTTDEDYSKEKNFITESDQEFQLASFNLKKDEEILRHYHPDQKRHVTKTSEALVLLDGEIEVFIYDKNQEFITSEMMTSGSTCLLIDGGHSLNIKEDSKFIEVKQGPYDIDTDKIRF